MTKYSVLLNTKHRDRVDENYFMRIDDGPYEGVEFIWWDLPEFEDLTPDAEGNVHINFEYRLLYAPDKEEFGQVEVAKFEAVLAEILKDLLQRTLEESGTEITEEADALIDGVVELEVTDGLVVREVITENDPI